MPNGYDKNWVRLCAALDGFFIRHGHWPTRVRLYSISLEDIRDYIFTPDDYDKITAKVNLVSDEVGMVAEDDSGNSYNYGDEGFPEQRPTLSAAEWLGVRPKRAELCEIERCIRQFFVRVASIDVEVYNEFSLQHEIGAHLRKGLPQNWIVRFERNVKYFGGKVEHFKKREIDISVFTRDANHNPEELLCAIELKFPRNGQIPEQMFSFCKDIQFAEELVGLGFQSAAVITFAEDPKFYQGQSKDIYEYFRREKLLTGIVQKPTGAKDDQVNIRGEYVIKWKILRDKLQYFMVVVHEGFSPQY